MMFVLRLVAVYVLNWVASLFVKPPADAEASKLGDFNFPKAREGDAHRMFWGTLTIRNAQVASYGDLRVEPIRQKGGKK